MLRDHSLAVPLGARARGRGPPTTSSHYQFGQQRITDERYAFATILQSLQPRPFAPTDKNASSCAHQHSDDLTANSRGLEVTRIGHQAALF